MGTDEFYMHRVLELASLGSGYVSPNPLVGAVIVKNDKIISEGWHHEYGHHHAERDAIVKCSDTDLNDSVLYVNLEPCNHHGKQPPCTQLIIEKKIRKVVIGSRDPNPNVSGGGIEALSDAGIEVVSGILREESDWLNRIFIKHITTKVPYVILKAAQTMDGFVALDSGESKWITCEESRKFVHSLRHHTDAIVIGTNTVEIDDPELTVRLVSGRNPLRVVLDKNLRLSSDLKIFQIDDLHKTVIFSSIEASKSTNASILKGIGVDVISVGLNKNGYLEIPEILTVLSSKFNIASILVEGGAELHSSIIRDNLADEIQIFIAPKFFGSGKSTFSKFNINKLADAPNYKIKQIRQVGSDIHVTMVK